MVTSKIKEFKPLIKIRTCILMFINIFKLQPTAIELLKQCKQRNHDMEEEKFKLTERIDQVVPSINLIYNNVSFIGH